MLFALDIYCNKKAPPTYSVHWGLNPPPPSKTSPLLFCQAPSKICKLSKSPFLDNSPPPQYIGFSCTTPKIGFFSELPKY